MSARRVKVIAALVALVAALAYLRDPPWIGEVTSGGFGPSLGKPIAMGYVATASAATGTMVNLVVRGKALAGKVAKMPFAPHRYHRN